MNFVLFGFTKDNKKLKIKVIFFIVVIVYVLF